MTTDLVEIIGNYSDSEVKTEESDLFQFKVYFDGGGSHDFAYGSFQIEFNGLKAERHRMPFRCYQRDGIKVTSNVAEYLSLIAALVWLGNVKAKHLYDISIYGDSQLVVNQVNGLYECHKPYLKTLRDICHNHLKAFGHWEITWHSRVNSVSRFGH